MIMSGIELSVIPRIDISTRVTGVTDGKEGVAPVMTRRGQVSSQSDRGTYPPPLEAATINSSTLVQLGGPGTHGNLAEFCEERRGEGGGGIGLKLGHLDRQDGWTSTARPAVWNTEREPRIWGSELDGEIALRRATKAVEKQARSIDKLAH
ncbi:hypothetical protein ALC62_08381 [Cyphomyrmex costatus]|uniref:Uncharacterized protein n=1 Tax=Cyphomyrmex costatus TaxID=456900 RepID=A0A151IH14_9HYME|nr:hypothetical protein ALC62_08381 [Cyphomyrmex costatus]